ncbi:hypothetical protein [Humibacillus xanthopallidus]|uniref:hypothetical protein n=1 Tax=Humibacillus xanthopallidus TaxID=412689 RepID=UPI00114D5738|nr:hypothetical protein [Humibacillus xanthopallidus]
MAADGSARDRVTPVVLVLSAGHSEPGRDLSASVLSWSALAEALRAEVAASDDVEHVFVAARDADRPELQAVLFVLRVAGSEAVAVAVGLVGPLVAGWGAVVVAAHPATWSVRRPTQAHP